jgi:hypothetical protein
VQSVFVPMQNPVPAQLRPSPGSQATAATQGYGAPGGHANRNFADLDLDALEECLGVSRDDNASHEANANADGGFAAGAFYGDQTQGQFGQDPRGESVGAFAHASLSAPPAYIPLGVGDAYTLQGQDVGEAGAQYSAMAQHSAPTWLAPAGAQRELPTSAFGGQDSLSDKQLAWLITSTGSNALPNARFGDRRAAATSSASASSDTSALSKSALGREGERGDYVQLAGSRPVDTGRARAHRPGGQSEARQSGSQYAYGAQWLAGVPYDAEMPAPLSLPMSNPAADKNSGGGGDDDGDGEALRSQHVARLLGMRQDDILHLPSEDLATLALALTASDERDAGNQHHVVYGGDRASHTNLSFGLASPSVLDDASDTAAASSASPQQRAKRTRRSASPTLSSPLMFFADDTNPLLSNFAQAEEDASNDPDSERYGAYQVPAENLDDSETIVLWARANPENSGPIAVAALSMPNAIVTKRRRIDESELLPHQTQPSRPW